MRQQSDGVWCDGVTSLVCVDVLCPLLRLELDE